MAPSEFETDTKLEHVDVMARMQLERDVLAKCGKVCVVFELNELLRQN